MYRDRLDSQARKQLLLIVGGIILGAVVTAPFLWPLGAKGAFLWSVLVLCGLIALGQYQDSLHEQQDRARDAQLVTSVARRKV